MFEAYTSRAAVHRESTLSRLIISTALKRLEACMTPEVSIAGAGPAGLTAAWKLAEKGVRVSVFERGLGVGGGMRGGSSLLPVGLIAEGAGARIAREAGVRLERLSPDIYAADPVELSVKLAAKAVDAGACILPGAFVEDLIIRKRNSQAIVEGVVIVLAPAVEAGWHIDPVYVESKAVVDATGHDASLVRLAASRLGFKVPGMGGLDVWEGERMVVEKTGQVLPGLYAAGMSVAELHGTPRMGPIFSGMLASGAKVAEIVYRDLHG